MVRQQNRKVLGKCYTRGKRFLRLEKAIYSWAGRTSFLDTRGHDQLPFRVVVNRVKALTL